MFVEKVILEQLAETGRIDTTIVQSGRGERMLLDYAERLDVSGACLGPYTVIRRERSALEALIGRMNPFQRPYRQERFGGFLTDHSFRPCGGRTYELYQEWVGIPVGPGGSGVAYALQLPKFGNIDHVSLRGDGWDDDNALIRDERIDAYFVSKVLQPKFVHNSPSTLAVSLRLACRFTVDENRFRKTNYEGPYARTQEHHFSTTNQEIDPAIQNAILSGDVRKREPFVFLSHKSADKEVVRQFAEGLKAAGLNPWHDEWRIVAGDSIPHEIGKGLTTSDILVLFMSLQSVTDTARWVESEYSIAFMNAMAGHACIIPVMIQRCELPTILGHIRYIDCSRLGVATATAQLIDAIQKQRAKMGGSEHAV